MMTATSGRIDINGRVNKCGAELTIARSMPVVLTGCMNDFVWTNFCDKIDETLVPINQLNRRMTICKSILICMLLPIPPLIILKIMWDGWLTGVQLTIAIILTMVSLVVMMCWSSCWASRKTNKALKDVREVCEAESAKHPDISFHLRDIQQLQNHGSDIRFITRPYIEVSVLNNAGPGRLAYGQGNVAEISTIPCVSAVPVALSTPPAFNPADVAIPEPEFDIEAGNKKSPAERMRTLEDTKGFLSEEEYQRKRAEIVSDV